MDRDVQKNWITFLVIWIATIILAVIIHLYNNYLSRTYLKGQGLNIVNAFEIISDEYYLPWLLVGLIMVLLLVYAGVSSLTKGNKEGDPLMSIIGPLVSLILLIILIFIYSNPILLALAIALGVGGAFIAGQQ